MRACFQKYQLPCFPDYTQDVGTNTEKKTKPTKWGNKHDIPFKDFHLFWLKNKYLFFFLSKHQQIFFNRGHQNWVYNLNLGEWVSPLQTAPLLCSIIVLYLLSVPISISIFAMSSYAFTVTLVYQPLSVSFRDGFYQSHDALKYNA